MSSGVLSLLEHVERGRSAVRPNGGFGAVLGISPSIYIRTEYLVLEAS